MDLIVKNGLCINSNGRFRADIGISNGTIVQLGQNIHVGSSCLVVDAAGAPVLPGVIDAHVHLPWPSANYDSVDDFHSGTKAAICGGVTTIIEYMVPKFGSRLIQSLEVHMEDAQNNSFTDYSFHMILTNAKTNFSAQMAEVLECGIPSFKIYTAYEDFQLNDEDVITVLKASKKQGALVCFHAESGVIVSEATKQLVIEGKTDIKNYIQAHPYEADVEAIQRVISFARFTGARIHIAHVNTRFGAGLIAKARRDGIAVSGETCPQYLIFTDDVYKTKNTRSVFYILAPAIRDKEELEGLWTALNENELQMVATDHCPYTSRQKMQGQNDFRYVPGGVAGIETSLSLLYTYGVRTGRISMERLVEVMSTNPAKIFNLFPLKGTISVGSHADLVIFDETCNETINSANLHSNSDHTIYDGMEILGWPRTTILRGDVIVEKGIIQVDQPKGQFIKRRPYL